MFCPPIQDVHFGTDAWKLQNLFFNDSINVSLLLNYHPKATTVDQLLMNCYFLGNLWNLPCLSRSSPKPVKYSRVTSRTLILRCPSQICAKRLDCSHIYHNTPKFREIQTWLNFLTRQLWQRVYQQASMVTEVKTVFSSPYSNSVIRKAPNWGNYRNCDRGEILSLYEDPLGKVLFANRNLCISLFDFLWSTDLSSFAMRLLSSLSCGPRLLFYNSCLTILVPVWFQLSLVGGTCGQ